MKKLLRIFSILTVLLFTVPMLCEASVTHCKGIKLCGKVKVVKISKRDYTMVVDFQNLKMRSDEGDIYTFDGKVTVYFEEY
jgi:hypothetical protein